MTLSKLSMGKRHRRFLSSFFLLLVVLVPSNNAAHAQSCPAPWDTAPFVYGTILVEGAGTGTSGGASQSIAQSYTVGEKLGLSASSCSWDNSSTSAKMIVNAKLKDVSSTCPSVGGQITTASGDGLADANFPSALFGFPDTSDYQFFGSAGLTTTFVITDCSGGNPSTTTIPITLGPDLGVDPQPIPVPSSAPKALSGSSTFSSGAGDGITAIPANWNVTWSFSPTPDDTCKDCEKNTTPALASNIGSQNQTLGEDIAIIGTPFSLHYQSDRQFGRAGADTVAIKDALSLGGWTLNVHHNFEQLLLEWCVNVCEPYAIVPKALFLGDGRTRPDADVQAPIVLKGKYYLTSEDGSEVYVFSNGLHVQTLQPMTGAVLYTFTYDSSNRLTGVSDANGNVTSILRDANGHPTSMVSPFGQITALLVNSNGYVTQITDPAGRVTKFAYTNSGLMTSYTDPKGNVYTFSYDSFGRLLKHSDPAGGFISLARTDTATGFSVSEKTAMGITSAYNVVFSHTSSSTTEHYTNTWPNGLKATSSDTQTGGQITESTTMPDGATYSDTLSSDPRWGIQVPIEASSKITLGNLTLNATSTRAATLGTSGNPFSLTMQTDTDTVNGRKYTSVFTASNRTYVNTSPAGRKATTVLDSLERISSVQLGTLLPVQFVYDSHGRMSATTQGTRKDSFTYNANGFLASVTDPLGLTDSFTYDADGHLLTKTLTDGRVITFAYDANGKLIRLVPPGKTAHAFAYNAVNFPVSYTPPVVTGTGATTYAYDKDQNLTTITRPDTKTIKFSYDTAGRLSSVVAQTETVNYAYNATTGNLASASIPSGEAIAYAHNGPLPTSSTWTGTVAGSVSRTFNNNFWLASQSLNGANTINFTYDNDGLVTKAGALTITHDPNNGMITATTMGNVTDTRTYNSFGELIGYTAKFIATQLYLVTYTRDADGRITSKVETINGKSTTYAYAYDKAGRLIQVTQNGTISSKYTYDTNSNRLTATTSSGTANGTYDPQDRLLSYGGVSFTYTANGELASRKSATQTTQYQYDVLGNLVSVTLPTGTKLTYLPDPENHRVAKRVNGAQQTGYLYDGDQIVAQLNGSNQIVSQFVYATSGNSPDYMVHGGATYRIISDQLGSPRLVVNTATGTIAEQMNYDEFGNTLLDSNAAFQPFGFAGGLKDPDTGLVRFGARDYNPAIGRWTAKDPILFEGGESNLYVYALSDPVNLTDRKGLDSGCKDPIITGFLAQLEVGELPQYQNRPGQAPADLSDPRPAAQDPYVNEETGEQAPPAIRKTIYKYIPKSENDKLKAELRCLLCKHGNAYFKSAGSPRETWRQRVHYLLRLLYPHAPINRPMVPRGEKTCCYTLASPESGW